ncbi:MAG: CYTH domain-containing protein [Treponema sp.]|jgi:adenylate cyclase class 2|nr:CYTH domain-containing protein [Treponema sp.]
MATEIEVKAWVTDRETLRRRLSSLGEYAGEYEKEDAYWFPRSGAAGAFSSGAFPAGVRVRKETRTGPGGRKRRIILVTRKDKEVREGIEVNDEREFRVSGAGAFEDFLSRLGLVPVKKKRKRGWSWKAEGITAELSLVEGLGWFIELEIMEAGGDENTVKAARGRLLAFLAKTGIPESAIETRYYTEMLEQREKQDHT